MQNPFIVGDRIYLRPLGIEDIDSFIYRNGKYFDVYYMGILEDEWRELNGASRDL